MCAVSVCQFVRPSVSLSRGLIDSASLGGNHSVQPLPNHFGLLFCIEPADEHVEGGIYISPEFQLGQVYDGAADVVEDVILYRPVYVCAPRPPGSDIGNGHSPSVRGVDHTPSSSPVAGSPSAAAGRPQRAVGGVTPSGSTEHVNAHSSPKATRTTKKIESTTTTIDGRTNEHHHQHHYHHHHPPHLQQKEELSEPLQQHAKASSHEVIVHGRDLDPDPVKPTSTEKAVTHADVRLTDRSDAGSGGGAVSVTKREDVVAPEIDGELDGHEVTVSSKHIRTNTATTASSEPPSSKDTAACESAALFKDHVATDMQPAAAVGGDCNSTSAATTHERDMTTNTACQVAPTN